MPVDTWSSNLSRLPGYNSSAAYLVRGSSALNIRNPNSTYVALWYDEPCSQRSAKYSAIRLSTSSSRLGFSLRLLRYSSNWQDWFVISDECFILHSQSLQMLMSEDRSSNFLCSMRCALDWFAFAFSGASASGLPLLLCAGRKQRPLPLLGFLVWTAANGIRTEGTGRYLFAAIFCRFAASPQLMFTLRGNCIRVPILTYT